LEALPRSPVHNRNTLEELAAQLATLPADGSSTTIQRRENPMDAGSRILREEVGLAHDGWAIDILDALARPREETMRIKSVVE
jgi:hypothetical protein